MTQAPKPVVISCGEPAGIGPEIAAKAWEALAGEVPVLWLGDPRHLPEGTAFTEITSPDEAAAVSSRSMAVLAHDRSEELV